METFDVNDTIDGRYTITRILGKGGMGMVLEATRPNLNTLVAIKVLLPELRDNADIAARFEREAKAADDLRSEHVARVFEVGRTPAGTPFIVMEHLVGEDLAHFLAARGKLPIAQAVDILLQPCEAIAEAHTRTIIHRDLKPANLFITKGVGGRLLVKVLDFGISKVGTAEDSAVTATNSSFGTPSYMAPEQFLNAKGVKAQTDVWALAVILYEMLTGSLPFKGDGPFGVSAAIMTGKFAKLSEVRPDVPAELDALVTESLATQVDERTPSVEAFARKLAPFATSDARQSYERIERLSGGKTHTEVAPPAPPVVELPETGDVLVVPNVLTEKPAPTPELPATSKKPSTRTAPLVAALAGVGLIGGFFGVRHVRQATPPADSSALAVVEPGPSASASAPVFATPAPSASAEPTPVASAAPSASAQVVMADPVVATPPAPVYGNTANECAKGPTPACEAACAAHAPGRCEALAKALVKATGPAKNVARAVTLYKTECDGGSGSACNSLGALYGAGTEVPKDEAETVRRYQKGCELGDRTACTNIGIMHFTGSGGLPTNLPLGVSFFVRGCPEKGPVEAEACLDLAIAYTDGHGAPKDLERSLTYAKRACENGSGRACTRLPMAKIKGEGAAKDVKGGLDDLNTMCAKGEPAACSLLTTLFTHGLGSDVKADPARVRAVADEGCKAHDAKSCKLKDLYATQDNGETGMAMSSGQLERSCSAGVLKDCGFLGERLISGIGGVAVDRPRGLGLLDTACKGGVTRSCQKLAEAGGR